MTEWCFCLYTDQPSTSYQAQRPARKAQNKKVQQFQAEDLYQPCKLVLKVPNEYSRFRYESEKTPKKRKKNYDYDDTDKQCLVEIKVSFIF